MITNALFALAFGFGPYVLLTVLYVAGRAVGIVKKGQ